MTLKSLTLACFFSAIIASPWPLPALSETCIEPLRREDPYTTRPLENFAGRFRPLDVLGEIDHRQAKNPDIKILEFGIGQGRMLMQLRKRFPAIELHGTNRCPWELPADRVLRDTALHFKIFTEKELKDVRLPVVHAFDASNGMLKPFRDAAFDFVISQFSLYMVDRKDLLIEEIWRVLKPGGAAIFDLGDFAIVDRHGNSLDLNAYLLEVARRGGFDIKQIGKRGSTYVMRKNIATPLRLGLSPVKVRTLVFSVESEAARSRD